MQFTLDWIMIGFPTPHFQLPKEEEIGSFAKPILGDLENDPSLPTSLPIWLIISGSQENSSRAMYEAWGRGFSPPPPVILLLGGGWVECEWDGQQSSPLDPDLCVGPRSLRQRTFPLRLQNNQCHGKEIHRPPCTPTSGEGDKSPLLPRSLPPLPGCRKMQPKRAHGKLRIGLSWCETISALKGCNVAKPSAFLEERARYTVYSQV